MNDHVCLGSTGVYGVGDGDILLAAAAVGLLCGTSAWWTYMRTARDPSFPRPIKFGARCTRWRKSEIIAWQDAHRAGR